MASPTQWPWVWVDSGSWWWTERPGILRFMGLQRVRHDWASELNCFCLNKWLHFWLLLYNFFLIGASQVAIVVKNPCAIAKWCMRQGFYPWAGRIPWRRTLQPIPAFLPGEFHGLRSLADRLQSIGLQRVRHDWSYFTCTNQFLLIRFEKILC